MVSSIRSARWLALRGWTLHRVSGYFRIDDIIAAASHLHFVATRCGQRAGARTACARSPATGAARSRRAFANLLGARGTQGDGYLPVADPERLAVRPLHLH